MGYDAQDDFDEPGFFQRHRGVLIGAGVVLIGAGVFFGLNQKPHPKKRASVSMVDIMPPMPPPPPPPPPPPKEEPPPQEEVKQDFQEETQTDPEPPKEAAPEAPAALGTALEGEGGPNFGLAKGGGSGMIGGTGKSGGGGASKYGWYAGQVQSVVVRSLQAHRRTRAADLSIKVRIWVDSSGRITRATLGGTSGNAEVDRAIQNEILTGLQLQEPPPADMPMPIVMRLNAKRPN